MIFHVLLQNGKKRSKHIKELLALNCEDTPDLNDYKNLFEDDESVKFIHSNTTEIESNIDTLKDIANVNDKRNNQY